MTRGTEPGYRRQRKMYLLKFDEYPGMWVRVRGASMGAFLRISKMVDSLSVSDPATMGSLFSEFAAFLKEWNIPELDDDDEPTGELVPTTLEGLLSLEFDMVMDIINAWVDAVSGVAAPLGKTSSDGSPLQEAFIPMELLSESQVS